MSPSGASSSLIFSLVSGPTTSAAPRSLLAVQSLRPHSRPAMSESAFSQDPPVIGVHVKIWEVLFQRWPGGFFQNEASDSDDTNKSHAVCPHWQKFPGGWWTKPNPLLVFLIKGMRNTAQGNAFNDCLRVGRIQQPADARWQWMDRLWP